MKKPAIKYGLALFCFLAACHISQKAQLPMQASFDKQGHRGCRGLMPENTFAAMRRALDLGVTTLEMDVVITKDKKVILSHEPFFNHEISTLNGKAVSEAEEKSFNIYKMTYAETQSFDVGIKVHPRFPDQEKLAVTKPLLADLLDQVAKYMSRSKRPMPFFNIETKTQPATDNVYHPGPEEFVDLLMTVIKDKKVGERVIIQSFDFRTLQYLHKNYPTIRTAMLIEEDDKRDLKQQFKDLGFNPTIYSPAFELVDDKLIAACHEKQIKVIPWTVNDAAEISKLRTMGVDGIISDFPNLFNAKR